MTTSASVGDVTAPAARPQPENALYALDAHNVPKTAAIVGLTSQEDAIVCRKERSTGTKFYRRVCYSRLEMEARAKADQETWHWLRSGR